MRPIQILLVKELRTELRSKSGLLTAAMFSIVTVIALAFAGIGRTLSGTLASGLIWVAILFAAVVALPRTFLTEEESGTSDLLRLIAPPSAVFWSKAIINFGLLVLTSTALSVIYLQLVGLDVVRWPVFGLVLVGGCAAVASTVTLCGAMVAQAQNRGVLAGAIALPLLIPFLFLAMAAMRFAFGEGSASSGWVSVSGVWLYAVASNAIGPVWFEWVWKS